MVGINELKVFLIAASPILELRFSIPLGFYLWGEEYFTKIFLLSIVGNFIPIIPLLLFLEPVTNKLRSFFIWRRFFDWFFEKTKRKAAIIQKYEALGLALFVAIPIPGSGIWTGCIAAKLFKIKFRYAFIAITIGMIIAGILISLVCIGIINLPIFTPPTGLAGKIK